MKQIWFTQQQQFDFMPLMAGLNMISEQELQEYCGHWNKFPITNRPILCPKKFTIRSRKMKGNYRVVQGSRYHSTQLYPPIEFTVPISVPFSLRTMQPAIQCNLTGTTEPLLTRFHTAELDLGIVGTTDNSLRTEIMKLTGCEIDKQMYLSTLEPLK